jgi:hypothetical protein
MSELISETISESNVEFSECDNHKMILFEKKSNERMYEFDEAFIEN